MKKRIRSKNYNKWRIIDVIAILVICILSLLYTHLSGVAWEELGFRTREIDILYIIVLVICNIPTFLGWLAAYFGIRYTIKKVEKKNLTYNASIDIPYWRECLEGLTPFEVSILANLDIEEKKDVAATILWYQNKKYIDTLNGQIIYKDNLNLSEKDNYFLTYIKTNDLGYLEAYKNLTYEELKQKRYIIENNHKSSYLKHIGITIFLFFLLLSLIFINAFLVTEFIVEKAVDIILIFLVTLITYKQVSFLMIGYKNRKSKFKRTKLGEEKTEYIHALQNFIHDFGNLKEANKEQIVLWEDFLVYAIILEENSKIVKEIEEFFNRQTVTKTP